MTKSISGDEVTKRINEARKVLKPVKVDYGSNFPGWFSKRLRAYLRMRSLRSYASYANCQEVLRHVEAPWGRGYNPFDHVGVIKTDKGVRVVFEPYDFDFTMHSICDAFATALGIGYCISPNSYHYPGYTMRIEFYERR